MLIAPTYLFLKYLTLPKMYSMRKWCFLIVMILIAGACKNLPTNESLSANGANKLKTFGAEITDEGFVTLDQATTMLEGVDSLPLKLAGTVKEVCQNKGCWMNVVSETGESQPIFVKFKDYGFFVPKDCAGKKVVMEGIAYREVTPVDELRHYAEDKGASAEELAAITEPKEELKFMASGVLLYENE